MEFRVNVKESEKVIFGSIKSGCSFQHGGVVYMKIHACYVKCYYTNESFNAVAHKSGSQVFFHGDTAVIPVERIEVFVKG